MYDDSYWDEYARTNESRYSGRFARLVRDMAKSLRCTAVLEVGCGTGVDLRMVLPGTMACGADLNRGALQAAGAANKNGNFVRCDMARLPFADSSADMVFSHHFLNCLDDETIPIAMGEVYRVARRYILNCERIGADGLAYDGPFRYRDLRARWRPYSMRLLLARQARLDSSPFESTLMLYGLPANKSCESVPGFAHGTDRSKK